MATDKDKEYMVVKINSMFWTAVQFFFVVELSGAQSMVWVIEGKFILMIWRETKITSS